MNSDPAEPLHLGLAQSLDRRRVAARRRRCRAAAQALFAAGALTVLVLCLWGLRPSALAIPVFCAALSLLCASASAALFARIAQFQLLDADHGEDEDGRGPGEAPGEPPSPPGGGGLEVDWARFEREFRSYCEQAGSVLA